MNTKLPLALLAATLAFGQTTGTTTRTPPSPATIAQMQVNRLAQVLNLTDAQKTTALSIFTTAITNAQTIQTDLRTNHTSMATAIQKNDTASIDSLATAAGVLQGKAMAINAKADAAFYQILTTDQKTLYDAMPHGIGGGPGGGMGRGGMGGGMMGGGPAGRMRGGR